MHFNTEDDQRVLGLMAPEHAQAAFLHAETLEEAARLMLHRTLSYGTVWQRFGAMSNLLNAARKVGRLMELWWQGEDGFDLVGDDGKIVRRIPVLHKDGLDDAFDAINYLAFFIQNARNGNLTGDNTLFSHLDDERDKLVSRLRNVANSDGLEDIDGTVRDELHKIADVLEGNPNV